LPIPASLGVHVARFRRQQSPTGYYRATAYRPQRLEVDATQILTQNILPPIKYEDYKRALCLLDPYGLDLDWQVIEAGKLGTVDIFLNFPVMDMNRNAIWRNPDNVPPDGIERMNRFWGALKE
jgi:three-Cys-motif partner protein